MSHHVRTWNFEVLLNKEDAPEDKELPDPSGPLLKVIPSSSIASCNTEVTKVLKQVKQSVTKVANSSTESNMKLARRELR